MAADTPNEETLISFPCDFPVKVVGRHSDTFPALVTDLVMAHVPADAPKSVTSRSSNGGKYLAVTVTIEATSKSQLDAIYGALTAHPDILWAL